MPTAEMRKIAERYEDSIRVVAELEIEAIWDRMLHESLGEWARLERQGLGAAEIEASLRSFLETLSDKPIESAARHGSTVAYNEGRDVAIRAAAESGAVQVVIRSEVLDDRTCGPCAQLDGMVIEVGSAEYDELMPPAKCEGGDNCRGFYVALTGGTFA